MARNAESEFPQWLHYFDTIESTNNYAMQLVDDGLAQHGAIIWGKHQTRGKGQRGKIWLDHPGNLKCSLIIRPPVGSDRQFRLSMAVALSIARYLNALLSADSPVAIKWPNDIYINDKKACGILIENVFRGMEWLFAVVGIGLNVQQVNFTGALHHATSLKAVSGKDFDFREIIRDLRSGILNSVNELQGGGMPGLVSGYNDLLYKKGKAVRFRETETGKHFEAFVSEVQEDGRLVLLSPTGIEQYAFGSLEWLL